MRGNLYFKNENQIINIYKIGLIYFNISIKMLLFLNQGFPMAIINIPNDLAQQLARNANRAIAPAHLNVSEIVKSLGKKTIQEIGSFYTCCKKTFKTNVIISPLNLRIGFSFKNIPLRYRCIISLTLIAITNLFLATFKYFSLPKHVNPISEAENDQFIQAIFKDEQIQEIKRLFLSQLDDVLVDMYTPSSDKPEVINSISVALKDQLYQIVNNHSLRILKRETKQAFNRFWSQNFANDCKIATQNTLNIFHETTEWQYSNLRFLDASISKAKVLEPLTKMQQIEIPSSVSFDTIHTWLEQINWNDNKSPYYMGPQSDPDDPGVNLRPNELKRRIQDALDIVASRRQTAGAPPANTPEFTKFYDKLEYKIKACIWKLQMQQNDLEEKTGGADYSDLDEDTQREYRYICENKARLACQIAIAGTHCPVRLSNEMSQVYAQLFSLSSESEEDMLLEEVIKKLLANLRLKVAYEKISLQPQNVHYFAAYMQSIGQAFNIPGSEDEIEHMTRFNEEQIKNYSQEFSASYTAELIVKELQEHYKKSSAFREKVQEYIKDQAFSYEEAEYDDLFLDLQDQINKKLEDIKNTNDNISNPSIDLFYAILNSKIVSKDTAIEMIEDLKESNISLEDFFKSILSTDAAKKIFTDSDFFKTKPSHLAIARQNWFNELENLDCKDVLKNYIISYFNAQESGQNLRKLKNDIQQKIKQRNKVQEIKKITSEKGLTGLDFSCLDNDEEFSKSLESAINVKQKSDYLEYILGEDGQELPQDTCEELLRHYSFFSN